MNYFGSRFDKTAESLSMLLDYDAIDFDVLMLRVSNVRLNENSFQILPFPPLFECLNKLPNIKLIVSHELTGITFPCLLGNINKKCLWNRIEKQVYQNEIDFVLLLARQDGAYYLNDADIAPNLLISEKLLLQNLSKNIVIEKCFYPYSFDSEAAYQENIINMKHKQEFVGSHCYLSIIDRIKQHKLLPSEQMHLYFSIKEQSVFSYKFLNLVMQFENIKLIKLIKKELSLFDRLLSSLSQRKGGVIIKAIASLHENRLEMESLT